MKMSLYWVRFALNFHLENVQQCGERDSGAVIRGMKFLVHCRCHIHDTARQIFWPMTAQS